MKNNPSSRRKKPRITIKRPQDYEYDLTISDLVRITALPASTIRYYEELGLIRPQRKNSASHRRYGRGEVILLNFISRGKTLGLSLDEIKELADLFWADMTQRSTIVRSLEILRKHVLEIDQKISELRLLKKFVKQEELRLLGLLEKMGQGTG